MSTWLIGRKTKYNLAMKILINKNSSEENIAIYMMESSGAAFCMLSYYEAEKHSMYLSNLNVDIDKRKKGYGKSILDYVISFSKKLGCKYLYISVDDKRSWVYKWYKRLGFVEYKKSCVGCDMFLKID